MNKVVRRSLMIGLGTVFVLLSRADPGQSWDLTMVNNAGETVLINYKRSPQGPLLAKLLEYGEYLALGRLSEATLASAGTFGWYMAPKDSALVPPESSLLSQGTNALILRINGVKNRSITKPFGEWDIELVTTQLPVLSLPKPERLLNAFPTVIKKLVPTPRFILGLPEDATVAAADDAAEMLANKWQLIKPRNPAEQAIVENIMSLIREARKAFHEGMADEPLRDIVSKGIRELTTTD